MTARLERHISPRPRPQAGVRLAPAALATALVTSSLHAGPIQPPRQALPSHCAEQISAQRTTWRALAPPIAVPPATPDRVLRHWSTDTLGVWLVEDVGPAEAVLARVGPDGITRLVWAAGCTATTERRPRPAAPAPAFTDADLARRLAGGGRGVLYLWSPHMPLSVDGYAAVADAARARGIGVDALLDPAADRTFARTTVEAHRLPAAAMRVADSVELQFRELALHAPSAAVYAEGRLMGSVLRGYRTADEYGEFFDRALLK